MKYLLFKLYSIGIILVLFLSACVQSNSPESQETTEDTVVAPSATSSSEETPPDSTEDISIEAEKEEGVTAEPYEEEPEKPVVITPSVPASRLISATANLYQKYKMLQNLDEGQITSSEKEELYKDLLAIQQHHELLDGDKIEILGVTLDMEMELSRLGLNRERNVAVSIIKKLK